MKARQRQRLRVVETQLLGIDDGQLLLQQGACISRGWGLAADEDPLHATGQFAQAQRERSMQWRLGWQLLVVVQHQHPRWLDITHEQAQAATQPAGDIHRIVGTKRRQVERRCCGAGEQRIQRLHEGGRVTVTRINLQPQRGHGAVAQPGGDQGGLAGPGRSRQPQRRQIQTAVEQGEQPLAREHPPEPGWRKFAKGHVVSSCRGGHGGAFRPGERFARQHCRLRRLGRAQPSVQIRRDCACTHLHPGLSWCAWAGCRRAGQANGVIDAPKIESPSLVKVTAMQANADDAELRLPKP